MEKKATRDALGAEVLALGLEHKDVFVIDCDVAKSCKTPHLARLYKIRNLLKMHCNITDLAFRTYSHIRSEKPYPGGNNIMHIFFPEVSVCILP